MGVFTRWRPVAVAVALLACVTGCGTLASPAASIDANSAATKVKLPGRPQACTTGNPTDRCSLADDDARTAVQNVAHQLRAMGLQPMPEVCTKATEKTPENCYVQVVFDGSQALTFFAFPHLLPTPPARFEGVETSLAVS